jgi:transposase
MREVSGKKSGRQPGHEGKTLEMVPTPDKLAIHNPMFCKDCGLAIGHLPAEMI